MNASKQSALFPFIDQFGRAAGFARDDLPAVKLEKLDLTKPDIAAAIGKGRAKQGEAAELCRMCVAAMSGFVRFACMNSAPTIAEENATVPSPPRP